MDGQTSVESGQIGKQAAASVNDGRAEAAFLHANT